MKRKASLQLIDWLAMVYLPSLFPVHKMQQNVMVLVKKRRAFCL